MFVALLYLGGRMVIAGGLAVEAFATLFLLLRRLYSPMRRIGKTANKYQLAKSSAERVFGPLGYEPTVTSPEDPVSLGEVGGRVTFEDVRFSYDEDEILEGVSLDVSPGETVGLAGTTSAGKSTLLKLVPRFYDPDAGSVRIGGTDVRDVDLWDLREEIGIVEQNPYLFSGTVRENIAYGDRAVDRTQPIEDSGVQGVGRFAGLGFRHAKRLGTSGAAKIPVSIAHRPVALGLAPPWAVSRSRTRTVWTLSVASSASSTSPGASGSRSANESAK